MSQMDYPDEDLDPLQLSLASFVKRAQKLSPSNPDTDPTAYVRFVLAGRLQKKRKSFRVSINAKQGSLPPSFGSYQLFRDIDSVIGITHDLPFKRHLALFPLPSFRDTLTEDNHVKHKIDGKKVSLHKIPNMALGTADRRHVTRIFFPLLYKKGCSPGILSEIREFVYEKCLRPAAIAINPADSSRWPITYSAAMTLCRDKKGTFHFGTIDFPAQLIRKFGDKFLELLAKHDGLNSAFFLHEFRGTKSSSHHNPENPDERKGAFDIVMNLFDVKLLDPNNWVVDVGLEIRQEGRVLQWLTEGHRRILSFLLPSASEEKISAILKSRTKYHCDISSQLGDLGGFRAIPGSSGKVDQVSYINVYTTEKSATYQLHEGIFRRRKPWHLFPSGISQLLKDMKGIGNIFSTCAGDGTDGLEGNARMEIRVPLGLAGVVFVELPYDVIEMAVTSLMPQTFWSFKYHRLAALSHVAKRLEDDDITTRLRNEHLALGAIVAYQLNALIYRPAEGQSQQVLLEAACQHVSDSNGRSRPILYDRGCYFLSDVMETHKSYHLPTVRPIDTKDLLNLYRRESIEDIEAEFHVPQKRRKRPISDSYPSKRQKMTRAEDNEDTNRQSGEATISDHDAIQRIIHQFPTDIFQLVPKPKANDAWLLPGLTPEELSSPDLFASFEFTRVFRQVQYKIVDSNTWETVIFDRYFPPKGAVRSEQLQGYPQALYYQWWNSLLARIDIPRSQELRDQVLQWFRALWWLPFPEADRMWLAKRISSTNRSGWVAMPPGECGCCLRLAVNLAHWKCEGVTHHKK